MPEPDWNVLLSGIRRRYDELQRGSASRQQSFLMHVENLAFWERHELPDAVDEARVKFPEIVHIAFATCLPDCGAAEFIVEGSTQECQRCGRHLFRHFSRRYELN